MEIAIPSLVYRYKDGLYINLTNRCPTACVFCIKRNWAMNYRGSNLNLAGAEPEPALLFKLIREEWSRAPFKELVFCGYGEPTMRLGALISVAGADKSSLLAPVPASMRVRLNTNGLGDLVNGKTIASKLKGLIDAVHISLNTADPDEWKQMMQPEQKYVAAGFESVLSFIRSAVEVIPETVVTAIEGNCKNPEKFNKLAADLGAKARLRPKLEEKA